MKNTIFTTHLQIFTQNKGIVNTVCKLLRLLLLADFMSCRLSLASSFEQQVAGAVLELDGDEESSQRKIKNVKRW